MEQLLRPGAGDGPGTCARTVSFRHGDDPGDVLTLTLTGTNAYISSTTYLDLPCYGALAVKGIGDVRTSLKEYVVLPTGQTIDYSSMA